MNQKAGDIMSEQISQAQKRALCKNMAVNLPSLRAQAGLSQDKLADRLGFSRQTISAIENGKRAMQWSTYSAIALFFSGNSEIKKLMFAMNTINDEVDMMLKADKKEL